MVLLVLLLVFVPAVLASRNPCHPGRYLQGKDVSCQVVSVPPKLCSACKLNPLGYKGNFQNCANIYNLGDSACKAELVEYARLNPCDKRRNMQVQNIAGNRVALDYFTYSICEQCCDCIPRGTDRGEYAKRKAAGTLLKVDRGNCPAHAHYDVCRVWPEIKYVKTPSESWPSNLASLPKICPLFKAWKFGPNGQNWFGKDQVYISHQLRTFLTQYMIGAQCRNEALWNECVHLEKSQFRV